MNKRVRLAPGLWNGRPALPVPIDFLGDDKNRFTVAFAFGATAASCFYMFLNVDAVSSSLKDDSWSKAFRGVAMTLTYGIINYPFLACLKAEYKIIGSTMGFFYSFVRLIVNLVLYFGCTFDKKIEAIWKSKNLGYLLFLDILVSIPVVLCTFLLVGSYAVLLYRELKKHFTQGTASFRNIFQREELKDESLTSTTDKTHVFLLFSNRLREKRVLGNNIPWYISLKNKVYQTRTDFKFSTQFLSAYLVSWIFVYQVTVILVARFDVLKGILQDYFTYQKASSVLNLFYDYLVASTVLAMIVAALQLCFFLRSHRSDVLKTYRTRSGLLPDEILHPKMIVGKSLRYCGYQIAFTAIGLLVNTVALFFFLTPIWFLHLMSMSWTSDQILELIRPFILNWILPLVIAPILTWLTLVLLSLFVFRDRNYPDFSISINNRRLFNIMSYFFFFFNILVGIWSGLMRILKGMLVGLVFFPRLDRTMMMRGYRKWDKGYMAYIGFLNVLVAFKHPVMLCFCQMLLDETRGISKEKSPNNKRPRVSTKALNRWFLAVLLMRNPSLVRYRKQGVHQGLQSPSTNALIIEMPAIVVEDAFPPLERLKSLDAY